MANNNYKFDSADKMSWLNQSLLLSLIIFISTYTILGWSIASKALVWAEFLQKQNIPLEIAIEEDLLVSLIKLLALLVIIIVTFLLGAPVALTTFLFEDSIHSDTKGMISLLLWSVVLVFALTSFDYFADCLVLISANLLLRMDLQKFKYRNWQIILITLFFAAIAFFCGMVLFDQLSDNVITVPFNFRFN